MSEWDAIGTGLWKSLAEFDTEPVRAEGEKVFRLAFVGAPGSGKTALGCALAGKSLADGLPPELQECLPEYRLPLSVDDIAELEPARLLILLLDATKGDYVQEVAAADYLSYLGRPMLVCYNKMDLLPVETRLIRGQARWRGTEIMPLSATQRNTVQELLVPAILEVLPEYALSLARHLPLFRTAVADRLVQRTALVNATFAAASGLAETVSVMRVPFSAEDIEVLSANQAAMTYRLALACGLATNWQDKGSGVSAVVEPGRLWQQFARQLMGVIPLWGLQSKVGVAYGGTVVLGRAIQVWCDTGLALTPKTLQEVCRQTATEARNVSRDLVAKAREALPEMPTKRARPTGFRLRLPRPRLPRRHPKPVCPSCGRANPADAGFCAYCGEALGVERDAG
jgi:uncharacterized protein (DUF697 family)